MLNLWNHPVKALLLSAFLLSGCATWSPTDNALAASLVACNAVDVIQTKKIIDNGGSELNPIYGSHPSVGKLIGIKISVLGLIDWLLNKYPENRTGLLIGGNAVCGGTLIWNQKQ